MILCDLRSVENPQDIPKNCFGYPNHNEIARSKNQSLSGCFVTLTPVMATFCRNTTLFLVCVVSVPLTWIYVAIHYDWRDSVYSQPHPVLLIRKFLDYACLNYSMYSDLHLTYFPQQSVVLYPELPIWQRHQKSQGILGHTVPLNTSHSGRENNTSSGEVLMSDNWPQLSKKYYSAPIPKSPYSPGFAMRWDYDASQLLLRADVVRQPPKIITWMAKPRHLPHIPELVRMRMCPEMPCRMTTNVDFREQSAALVWFAQYVSEDRPPPRSNPDQVFVFYTVEPPYTDWICSVPFRRNTWKAAFNWTMHYRLDADILSVHGLVAKRSSPPKRNYPEILAKKTKLVAWVVSHGGTIGKRDEYVRELQKYIPVDIYGAGKSKQCPRDQDDLCFERISKEYKFYLAFENAFCKDYISEKFFRYLRTDAVIVARGSNEYQYHAPSKIFINTADFETVKDLADHLLYLDKHPEEYLKILKAKDEYDVLYEDYAMRSGDGHINYMTYLYEAASFCEMCRRLWNVDSYRKTISDISRWVDKELCYLPTDI